jgi:hypothetical protein
MSYAIGMFIGSFILVLIVARVIRKILKSSAPKIVGLPRVLLSVGTPVVLSLVVFPQVFIFYLISAVIHGFFMYDEEKKLHSSS